MSKKQILAIILLPILFAVTTIGGAVAYMIKASNVAENEFEIAYVDCEITNKDMLVVKNTGSVKAYIRVRIVTYWVDSKGFISATEPSLPINFTYDGNKWLREDNTFYFRTPVDPNSFTDGLFAGGKITLKTKSGYTQVVEYFADAIQAAPLDAVSDSWKVNVGADGTINSFK